MKADKLLRKNKSVTERATEFVSSIKRNIQKDVLDVLTTKLDGINDNLFEKKDFSLETNINLGQAAMTRAACEQRFKDIIELEYKKELLEREIKIKTKSFNKYFGEDEDDLKLEA
jgi:hypothetical protein